MPMLRGGSPRVRRRVMLAGALSAPLLALARPLWAGEHVVRMQNKGAAGAFVFEPAILRIAPAIRCGSCRTARATTRNRLAA
jgi:hypothetical protein